MSREISEEEGTMQLKYEKVHRLAVCVGCPFSKEVSGSVMCQKFKNGEFLQHIEDIGPETCDRLEDLIINQLKLSQVKLAMGFLIDPCEDDPGEAEAILTGPLGIVYKAKISDLFPNESLAVFPSLRVFNASGEDVTKAFLEAALRKSYENAPSAVTDPFVGLLDEE